MRAAASFFFFLSKWGWVPSANIELISFLPPKPFKRERPCRRTNRTWESWWGGGDGGLVMLPLRAYGVAFASLLAGASLVHNVYKPDLTIPGYEVEKKK